MATTWKELRKELNISAEDEQIIELEKELIRAMIKLRQSQGLTQTDLAKKCNMKQPLIARIEKSVHSPQVDSLLKILAPMGYTLQIVPIDKK